MFVDELPEAAKANFANCKRWMEENENIETEVRPYTRRTRLCMCGNKLERCVKHDARGIPLGYGCSKCWPKKLKSFRPEVLTNSNYDADEPIEPEEY